MTDIDIRVTDRGSAEDLDSMPTMAQYLAADTRPVPEVLFERSQLADPPLEPVPTEVFTSRDCAQLEFDRLWSKVWQVACREREIPEPGDHHIYEIGDQSIVVVRGTDLQIRAFHNVCLHRGTRLVSDTGSGATSLRCSFHGWTWGLDGALSQIPCRWDFPHIAEDDYHLREVRTATWNGFVFINFDAEAPPLEEFLGDIVPRHFRQWPMTEKVKVFHVGKILNCNWKLAVGAFLETYHAFKTHPELAIYTSDANAQYDHYGLHARQMIVMGVPSPHVIGDLSEEEVVEAVVGQTVGLGQAGKDGSGVEFPEVGPGQTARTVLADWARAMLRSQTGADHSRTSDTELLDVIQYFVFPNLMPFGGAAFPFTYRARPWGTDPEWCVFEVMLMSSVPDGVEPPPDAPLRLLAPEQSWTEASEMGNVSKVTEEDTANMLKMQHGLHSRGLTHVTYSNYHERNIRQFHANIARYLEDGT